MLNVITALKTLIKFAPRIAYGKITDTSTAGRAYKDYTVTFKKAFKNTPMVVACFESTSTGYGFGSCSIAVNNITKTGFKIRVFNNDTATRAPYLLWLAIDATNWGGVIRNISRWWCYG